MPHHRQGDQIRVLVVGLNYAPETTGIAPYTTALARHLAAADHDVTVIAGHPHYPEWQFHAGYKEPRPPEQDRGVRLVRVRHSVPRNPNGPSRASMEMTFAWRTVPHLVRERAPVVVVISPALLALVPALLFRRVLRYRVGALVQDLYGAALSETGLAWSRLARAAAWIELALLRRVDGIVVIHEVFRQKLVASGIPEDRVEVIPNWAHVRMPTQTDRAATRRRLGWRDDEFVALHAGNMGAKQELEGLLDVAHLAEKRGSRVRVVLLGDGSRKEALREHARGLQRLTLLDLLPHGPFESAVAAADCLLLHEKPGVVAMSVPSKLTTYFAAGLPIVAATDPRSGAASLIRESDAGLVVQTGDPESIFNAIEDLAGDMERAAAHGESGRRYAREHLSAAVSLGRLEAWVRGLV